MGKPFQRDARMAFENRGKIPLPLTIGDMLTCGGPESSTGGFQTANNKTSHMNSGMARKSEAILEAHIHRKYNHVQHEEAWRNLPEIPTSAEIMPEVVYKAVEEKWDDYQKEFLYDENLPTNKIHGPWSSKEDYIGAHYQIHREDAIACLRKSVNHFKRYPSMMETKETAIYTNVRSL